MQIKSATKDELALLIHGLRAIHVHDLVAVQKRLLAQLETELSTRYGARLPPPKG